MRRTDERRLEIGENRNLTFFLPAHRGEREQLDLTRMKWTRRDLEFIDWLICERTRFDGRENIFSDHECSVSLVD